MPLIIVDSLQKILSERRIVGHDEDNDPVYGSYTDLQAYEERLRVLTTFSRQTRSTDTPAPLGTPIITMPRVNKSAGKRLTLDDVPGKAGQVFVRGLRAPHGGGQGHEAGRHAPPGSTLPRSATAAPPVTSSSISTESRGSRKSGLPELVGQPIVHRNPSDSQDDGGGPLSLPLDPRRSPSGATYSAGRDITSTTSPARSGRRRQSGHPLACRAVQGHRHRGDVARGRLGI